MHRYRLQGGMMVRGAAALGLALLAGGCASIRDHRGYLIDPALTDSVQPGVDNRVSVERALGQPTIRSQFGSPTAYYVSIDTRQAPFRTPRTSAQTVLRVNFDAAGNVSSVQRSGAEGVVRISPDGHATPTLGRHRGFFEDLFGNIGTVGSVPGAVGQAPTGGRGPNGS